MKKNRNNLPVLAGMGLAVALALPALAAMDAKYILKENSITGGLIVVTGFKDAAQLAGWRAGGTDLVQGMDRDNLVNLLVVAGSEGQVSNEEMLRVLRPGGVAMSLDPRPAPQTVAE